MPPAIELIPGGHLFYLGSPCVIHGYVERSVKDPGFCSVSLKVNENGVPIGKSTVKQFWPILCIVNERNRQIPFVVSVFCSDGKP